MATNEIIHEPVAHRTVTLTFNPNGQHTGAGASTTTSIVGLPYLDQERIYSVKLARIHCEGITGLTKVGLLGFRLAGKNGLPSPYGYGDEDYVTLMGSDFSVTGTTEFKDLYLAHDFDGGIKMGSFPTLQLKDLTDNGVLTWTSVTVQLNLEVRHPGRAD